MERAFPPLVRRWAFNLALFYAVLLAVGLVAGVIGAVGEDRFNTGTGGVIHYTPGPGDPHGEETVTVQGTEPNVGFLLLYPFLALLYGSIVGLPLFVMGLACAEGGALLGASRKALRTTALIVLAVAFLLFGFWEGAGVVLMAWLGALALVLRARLPGAAPLQPSPTG